jgi:type I restriction-modification system DNA methylase subunit
LQANFQTWVNETNLKLQALSAAQSDSTKVENAVALGLHVLTLITDEATSAPEDIIGENFIDLPNAERFDSWFRNHPDFAGPKSAFELLDGSQPKLQAKLYWLKKRSHALMAGAVHFTPNWEDAEWSRNENYKVGIDFFLSPDAKSFHIVLSNFGKLRVLEFTERLTNTDIEVLEKWHNLVAINNLELLHSTIWDSFKLQSVNAKFYNGVADAFTELHTHLLKIGKPEQESKMFASRLLGRLIFIWFIRKMALISPKVEYFSAAGEDQGSYYRSHLERLFFRTLNRPMDERRAEADGTIDLDTPYLNGGLFSPRTDDWVGEQLPYPNEYFTRLFEHFGKFNFTTDESTPEYEQVAIDPEMLGRVFESLLASQIESTGEQARKAKGAFYTPREIVAHMCRETVRSYLNQKFANAPKYLQSVELLIDKSDQDWSKDGSNSLRDISPEIRTGITFALEELRTLDPACGSGAFPLGLLQLLAKLHLRLDPRLDRYKVKLSILQNNIFGLDIEPMAIEISRLRSWLSLVVEEQNLKSVEPLPNLEFNFVCANSLIPLQEADLFTDDEIQANLEKLRKRYFAEANPAVKASIQNDYLKLTNPDLIDDRSNQLKTFNPFDAENPALFFDPEIMFGITSGFDVVIGNPPYIGEKGHTQIFEPIRNTELGRRFYQGKMDYFYFFFHMGLDLLKPDGSICLITTNYYVTATFGSKLVEDLKLRSTLKLLLNFNEIKLFESATGQHNLITLLKKGKTSELCKVINVRPQFKGKVSDSVLSFVLAEEENYVDIASRSQESMYEGSQIRLFSGQSSQDNQELNTMAATGLLLGDFYDVRQGVLTGADKVSKSHLMKYPTLEAKLGEGIFVLTQEEIENLGLDKADLEIVRPYFKNSSIQKYSVDQGKHEWLLYADKKEGSLESRRKLLTHLNKFDQIIQNSSDNSPYLHRPRNFDFESPSIVCPQRSNTNTFGYTPNPFYSSADVYLIGATNKSPFSLLTLTGLLNSKLYFGWLYNRGKRKGEMLELFQVPISSIPLPKINAKNSEIGLEVEKLVLGLQKLISESKQDGQNELIGKIEILTRNMFDL